MTNQQRELSGPRIKEVRLSKNMTLKDFYASISIHVNNFSPIEKGKRRMGKRTLEEIMKKYNISETWLITGKGSYYNEEEYSEIQLTQNPPPARGVPYLNINLTDLSNLAANQLHEKAEYYVNFRPFNDCDAYLPVYGDSMYPKYASGEIIAVREVLNKDIIQWGEAYLIIADEYANDITTVKLLFEHVSNDKIVLRASNPNYKGDTILDREAIKKLFIVKGKITRNQL